MSQSAGHVRPFSSGGGWPFRPFSGPSVFKNSMSHLSHFCPINVSFILIPARPLRPLSGRQIYQEQNWHSAPAEPSHHPGLLCIFPHFSPVTMLAELHTGLPIEPHRLCNSADRALPDIRSHSGAPGKIHGPGQRDRCHLLRFYRLVVTRAADPPGFLPVLGPGPSLCSVLLHIPGALLPAGMARGLRLRDLEFFVVARSDGPDPILVYSRGVRIRARFSRFTAHAVRGRASRGAGFFFCVAPGGDRFLFTAFSESWRH